MSSRKCDYEKDYMKIKFDSDDNLPLNKLLKFHIMTITIRSVFQKDVKLYPQVLFRWYFVWITYIKMLKYDRIDISEGILAKKSVIFVTIGILKILVLNMNLIFVMDVMI